MSALTIRDMQPDDVHAVSELAMRVWRAHYVPHVVTTGQIEYMLPRVASAEVFARLLNEKGQRLWLVEDEGILQGYIALAPRANNEWFIDKFYIEMQNQRRGLGRLLLEHATREMNPSVLSLRVNRKNYQAVNFYFKHGFFIEALDVLDIGGGFVMDDFLMKKVL